MNLESLRHWYMRRVVATSLRTIGYDVAVSLADRLAAGVFGMNTPGRRFAEERVARLIRTHHASGGSTSYQVHRVRPQCISDPTTVVREMYQHMGRFWIEALFLERFLRPLSWHRFVSLDGATALHTLARSRRGCVFATAYFGNVAACAYVLGRYFRPIHVLVDFLDQPQLRAWQRDLYNKPWLRPVTREQAADVLPTILGGGGAVLLVCGAELPSRRAIDVEFLGDRLACPPTPGRLARWFNVPVAAVTCRRELARRFGFEFSLHDVATHDGTPDGDARVVRQTMAALEAAILRDPAQFPWSIPMSGERAARTGFAVSPPNVTEMTANFPAPALAY